MADQKNHLERGTRPGWALAWLAAAVGVPSAVAALKWQAVAKHPVLSTVILVLVTVLIGATGLIREVWRAKYNDRVVEWISAGLDRRISRFGVRYREYLLSDLRFIDLKGLVGRHYDPDLSDVYVDVALQPRDPGKVLSSDLPAPDPEDLPTAGQRHLIADFLGKPQPRVLAVIGAPGSGKTTLLRHTARQLCTNRRRSHGRRTTPILLYLRDHASTIAADPQVALPALVASVLARYGLAEPRDWLERRLRAGQCIVLLDGLDEVAREEDRKAVSDWVAVQVTRYRENDFVVTSRPLGYQNAPIEGAITVQTQPFTTEQVSRFVHAWYLAEERHSTGANDQDITKRATIEANDLLDRLQGVPALRDLTVNPLLLTMITTLHRHHGALPGSRADLYAQICQVLLWRRHVAKKLKVEPRGGQKERLMRVLAFEMMRRKVRDVTTTEATAILRPTLRRVAKELTAEEFLDDAASNGLFIERENGVRTFAHLTFQEYLAAAHIKDKNLQYILIAAVDDIWWRETTLLYVAGTDAGPIVEACLSANTLPALTLALDCAEEAGELAEDLQGKVEEFLGARPGADIDPDRRKLMIGVIAARHLRQVIETGNGTRICRQPITNRIYHFFMEDMAQRGQHRPPDAPSVQLADPNEVVTGMRESDAVAFVNWVNGITDGQRTYRLPLQREIQDAAASDDTLTIELALGTRSIWLDTSEDPPRLHPLDNSSHPWIISGATLQEHLKSDFRNAPITLGLLPLLTTIRVAVSVLLSEPDFNLKLTHLAHHLHIARDLAQCDASARDPAVAAALAVAVDLERDLSRASGRGLDPGLDLRVVRDLVSLLDYAFTRDFHDSRARSHLRAHGLGRSRIQDLSHFRDLDRVLDLNRVLDLDLDLSSSHHLIPGATGRALARDARLTLANASETFLGHMLSQMVMDIPEDFSPETRPHPNNLRDSLAAYLSSTVIEMTQYSMPPDLLADIMRIAIGELRKKLIRHNHPSAEWARRSAWRFESMIEPILARDRQLTKRDAAALRILAICLGSEAAVLNENDLSNEFKVIAAAITLLERRADGTDRPAETILLALN